MLRQLLAALFFSARIHARPEQPCSEPRTHRRWRLASSLVCAPCFARRVRHLEQVSLASFGLLGSCGRFLFSLLFEKFRGVILEGHGGSESTELAACKVSSNPNVCMLQSFRGRNGQSLKQTDQRTLYGLFSEAIFHLFLSFCY